jgi:hypothetical protein
MWKMNTSYEKKHKRTMRFLARTITGKHSKEIINVITIPHFVITERGGAG